MLAFRGLNRSGEYVPAGWITENPHRVRVKQRGVGIKAEFGRV